MWSLNTIRFYIILKLTVIFQEHVAVWILYVFTSFSNYQHKGVTTWMFEYYTFLHHSQTLRRSYCIDSLFEYYTFLHHSQTSDSVSANGNSLNTIRFYIILKPFWVMETRKNGLNTIRFYIILKPQIQKWSASHAHTL